MDNNDRVLEKYDEAAPEFELLRKILKARKRADLASC